MTLDEIFDRCIPIPESGCWVWDGYVTEAGYASRLFTRNGVRKNWRVHRVSYEATKGPIPADRQIDHLCRVRCCVNPDHLEAVTHAENALRGFGLPARNSRKTHCIHGHELSGKNLRPRTGRRVGHRDCRACKQAYDTRRRARLAALRQKETT